MSDQEYSTQETTENAPDNFFVDQLDNGSVQIKTVGHPVVQGDWRIRQSQHLYDYQVRGYTVYHDQEAYLWQASLGKDQDGNTVQKVEFVSPDKVSIWTSVDNFLDFGIVGSEVREKMDTIDLKDPKSTTGVKWNIALKSIPEPGRDRTRLKKELEKAGLDADVLERLDESHSKARY